MLPQFGGESKTAGFQIWNAVVIVCGVVMEDPTTKEQSLLIQHDEW